MSDTSEGYLYLTVKRDWRNSRTLKAVKVTNKYPDVLNSDEVVVRVYVVVPQSAFKALDGGAVVVAEDALLPEVTQA